MNYNHQKRETKKKKKKEVSNFGNYAKNYKLTKKQKTSRTCTKVQNSRKFYSLQEDEATRIEKSIT